MSQPHSLRPNQANGLNLPPLLVERVRLVLKDMRNHVMLAAHQLVQQLDLRRGMAFEGSTSLCATTAYLEVTDT